MSNINQLVLESFNLEYDKDIIENYESSDTKRRLDNMHVRPVGEWMIYKQKPGHLFDRNGKRI